MVPYSRRMTLNNLINKNIGAWMRQLCQGNHFRPPMNRIVDLCPLGMTCISGKIGKPLLVNVLPTMMAPVFHSVKVVTKKKMKMNGSILRPDRPTNDSLGLMAPT